MAQVPVKLVLLAGSPGNTLANELISSGALMTLVQESSSAVSFVNRPLLQIGGSSLLDQWMAAVRGVARLLPIKDKVFIVTNNDAYGDIVAWAFRAGVPESNILNNGASHDSPGGSSPLSPPFNPVADLAAAIRAFGLDDSHLLVIEADAVPEPGLNLQRIVEHSLIRAKDTVTCVVPPPGHEAAPYVGLEFAEGGPTGTAVPNPRVTAAEPNTSAWGPFDGHSRAVMGPILLLRRASLPDVLAEAKLSKAADKQLGCLVSHLASSRPVYALHLEALLHTRTRAGLQAAAGFLAQCGTAAATRGSGGAGPSTSTSAVSTSAAGYGQQQQQGGSPSRGPAAEALAQVLAMSAAAGGPQATGARGEQLPDAYYPALSAATAAGQKLRQQLLKYLALAEVQAAATAGLSAGTIAAKAAMDASLRSGFNGLSSGTLPVRFADPTTRRHKVRDQHPVYTTSNNDYGRRAPGFLDMPDSYSGSNGCFSKTFSGPVRDGSLVTAVTRSKVHKALDDF